MFPTFPLDLTIFYAINRLPHSWVLDSLALIIHYLTYGGFLFAAWFLLNALSKDNSRALLGKLQLVTFAIASILEYVGKVLTQRIRPYDALTNIFFIKPSPGGYSFPSGQATIAFAAATVYYVLFPDKPESSFFIILAFLTAIDRIYMGHHYPSDVLAGAILGIVCGLAVTLFYNHRLKLKKQ